MIYDHIAKLSNELTAACTAYGSTWPMYPAIVMLKWGQVAGLILYISQLCRALTRNLDEKASGISYLSRTDSNVHRIS